MKGSLVGSLVCLLAFGCSAGNGNGSFEEGSVEDTGSAVNDLRRHHPPHQRFCAGDEDCRANQYCETRAGTCGGRGTCKVRPEICTRIYNPVCGCDGRTYGNPCEASAAGVSLSARGECESVFCGGFAGIACPGAGNCVDDPSDDCDPQNGGADCGGICECVANALCIQGSHFDTSPAVCACVPDAVNDPCASVRCRAGTHCSASGGTATCVPDDGADCGSVTCPSGTQCCNASCGWCRPPGILCPQIACE
jgi:hypothetical protein